jgi:hypothetical protein
MFPLVREAVAAVMAVERLRHVGLSHFEADECGALNEWLAAAPQAAPLCSQVAAMVSVGDVADRPPRALADGETLVTGRHTPAVARHAARAARLGLRPPDGHHTGTFFCGDLFTQPGTASRR